MRRLSVLLLALVIVLVGAGYGWAFYRNAERAGAPSPRPGGNQLAGDPAAEIREGDHGGPLGSPMSRSPRSWGHLPRCSGQT